MPYFLRLICIKNSFHSFITSLLTQNRPSPSLFLSIDWSVWFILVFVCVLNMPFYTTCDELSLLCQICFFFRICFCVCMWIIHKLERGDNYNLVRISGAYCSPGWNGQQNHEKIDVTILQLWRQTYYKPDWGVGNFITHLIAGRRSHVYSMYGASRHAWKIFPVLDIRKMRENLNILKKSF